MAANQQILPSPARRQLTIFQWNANGILPRLAELKNFITTSKFQPDILCIQETHLKKTKRLILPNYNVERRDRPGTTRKGGVATLIRKNINYTVLNNVDNIEELSIKIRLQNQQIIISNIYNPPGNKLDQTTYHTIASQANLVLLGDFNAHLPLFGGTDTNAEGRVLEEVIEKNDLVVLNDQSGTYLKKDGSTSALDITICSKSLGLKCSWTVHQDTMGSDHFPIISTINESTESENTDSTTRYSYKRADWITYKAESKQIFSTNFFHQDNTIYNNNIISAIHQAAANSIPKVQQNSHRNRPVPYWNSKCQDAVKKRKKAEHRMRRTKELSDCIEYRRSKAEAQKTIREEQTQHWQEYCSSLTPDSKLASVWKMAKKMSGTSSNSNIPTLIAKNQQYESAAEKARILAETLTATTADDNYSDKFKQHRKEVQEKWKSTPMDTSNISPEIDRLHQNFDLHELQTAVRQCKNSSAPGNDDITYELIKHLPKIALQQILQFLNKLWKEEKIVPEWKEAIVLPFHKPGSDKSLPTSYRPISLTPALCKILERLITTRLSWYLETHNLFNPNQSAYRKNRCTLDHLIRLHDDINKNINNKGLTVAIMFDFSKAFDMMWKDGLLHKLQQAGIHGRMHNWIKDFLSNRKIRVKVSNTLSQQYELQNGTPQGSVISPILFLLMINDFPTTEINNETSLFADDSAIWRSGKRLQQITNKLKPDVEKIEKWCDEWGFKLNEKKTVAIVFSKNSQLRREKVQIAINGKLIETVSTVKFLGLTFDQNLNWNDHINNIAESCKKKINLMRSLTGQHWGAGKRSLIQIYRTLVRPKMEYGLEVLHTASKASWKKLEVIQHTCLRIACGAMRGTPIDALQQECGELPLQLRRKRATLRYTTKISSSNNNPAKSVLEESWHNTYGKFKPGTAPIHTQTRDFITKHRATPSTVNRIPPWTRAAATVDLSLQQQLQGTDNNIIIKQIAADHLQQNYKDHLQIYSDGSVLNNRQVGAAFHIPSTNVEVTFRLNDSTSIITAELTAIQTALQYLQTTDLQQKQILILTDSQTAIQLITTNNSTYTSTETNIINIITDLQQQQQLDITLVWIPSHVGIQGNETADRLAKEAATRTTPDITTPPTRQDINSIIDRTIEAEWQQQYNTSPTAAIYKTIEPTISRKLKYTDSNRRKETTITRLRLGKCLLNCYLHRINRHQTGLCDHCKVPETITHFLLDCQHANIFHGTAIRDLPSIFNSKDNINKVYSRTQQLQRRL